jgi:hypothetical protein
MSSIINYIVSHYSEIVAIAGSVVIVARIIVKLTPTPKDDSILEYVVGVLKHLGLHINKDQ